MFLTKLVLHNFRNYPDSVCTFNRGGNLLFGRNGQGKTNLLEAIYYLSVFRSFRRGASKDILRWHEDRFRITGFFDTADHIERTVDVHYERGNTRSVYYENERVAMLSKMVGYFPAVVLSPESLEISQGLPGSRRRFLDLCFSTVDAEYLSNLIAYKKVLKHRNSLLLSAVGAGDDKTLFDSWTEKLVQHGSFLIGYRIRAVEKIAAICREVYASISHGSEEIALEYASVVPDPGNIEESFRQELDRHAEEEQRRKTTLTGPHRDDVVILLNGHDARKFGSHGQHKTILLALKSAELQYISLMKNVQPVILLDDLFALLDTKRIMAFLSILRQYGQFFITANTSINPVRLLSEAGFGGGDFSQFSVESGSIQDSS